MPAFNFDNAGVRCPEGNADSSTVKTGQYSIGPAALIDNTLLKAVN